MTEYELIKKDYYPELRTAINALKFINRENVRLVIDLEYGVSLNIQPDRWLNNYFNGGYPIMFVHYNDYYDKFWFSFYNVSETFKFPWEEGTYITKKEMIEAGYYFQDYYYCSQEENELLPF